MIDRLRLIGGYQGKFVSITMIDQLRLLGDTNMLVTIPQQAQSVHDFDRHEYTCNNLPESWTGFDYWLIVAGNFVAPEFGALLSRALGFRALLSKENSFSNVGGFYGRAGFILEDSLKRNFKVRVAEP